MFVVLKNGEKYYVNRKTKMKIDGDLPVYTIASSGFDTKEEAEEHKKQLEAENPVKISRPVTGRWKSYRKTPKKARR